MLCPWNKSASNVNELLSNIKDMTQKCRNVGVKYIFASALVYTKRIITDFLEDVHLKLVNVCKEIYILSMIGLSLDFIFLGTVCMY